MPRAKKKVRLTSLDDMAGLIQKVRREYRKSMNQINAITVIRESVPDEIGLKGSKEFFDYIRDWDDGFTAGDIALGWCPKHWCAHSMDHNESCVNGYDGTSTLEMFEAAKTVAAKSPQAKVAECDRPYQCSCGVGKTADPSCTNEWHKAAYWITANPEKWAEVLQQL